MTQDDIDKIRHHVAELVALLKMDIQPNAAATAFDKLAFHAVRYGAGTAAVIKAATENGQHRALADRAFAKAYNATYRASHEVQQTTFASAPNPGLQNLPKATMPAYTDPAASQGHDPVHQGLQKHSIGDTYPWAVVGIGNGDKVHYEVHNLCTGKKVYDHGTGRPYRYADPGAAYTRADKQKHGMALNSFQYLA